MSLSQLFEPDLPIRLLLQSGARFANSRWFVNSRSPHVGKESAFGSFLNLIVVFV